MDHLSLRNRASHAVSVLTALIIFGWHAAAWSQAEINLPPRQDTKSATGVSFKTGSFALDPITDLSIGGEGGGGLRLMRSYGSGLSPAVADNTNAQGWTYNTVAMISRNRRTFSPSEEPPPNPQLVPLNYTVSTGTKSVSFLAGAQAVPPANYTPISPGGETLTFTQVGNGNQASGSFFTFTDSDGSVYTFPWASQTRLQTVVYPDGTRLDFTYVVAPTSNRVTKSIISNRGYAILFDGPTKACIVNMADTFITATSTCPTNAPSVTYSYTTSTFNSGVSNFTGATNALGQTTTYSYVGADHLGCVKEPGQTACKISNLYNVCLPRPEDASNPPANLRYSDQVISQTTGTGETYTYSYQFTGAYEYCSDFTGYGATTTLTAPGNAVMVVGTNGAGVPTAIRDPLNRNTFLAYSENPSIEWEQALPRNQTDPEGNVQEVTRDTRANIIEKRTKAKPGTGLADLVVTAGYPTTCTNRKTCNKPDYVIDAKGFRTDYTYDPNHGGIVTETHPADINGIRPQKRYSYAQLYAWIKNSSGSFVQAASPVWMLTGTSECMRQATCVGTADEIKTTITYGTPGTANNLLATEVTVSSGNGVLISTTTTTYDSVGNALLVDGPLPGAVDTTRYRYDALRRVIGVVGPDPDGSGPLANRATRSTYDITGRLTKVERGTVTGQSDSEWNSFVALETTDTSYDVMGRKLREVDTGDGLITSVTQHSYDSSGRLDCTATRMDPSQWSSQTNACAPQSSGLYGSDRVTKLLYDAAGQLRKRQVALGTSDQADELTYTYTLNGKNQTALDGENNLTTYEYDGFDRLRVTRYPVMGQGAQASSTSDFEQYTYDANGNVIEKRLRDGQVIGFGFDNLNRTSLKNLPAPEADVSFTYDLQGRPLSAIQGSVSITRTYDVLGRMRTESTALGTMAYEYDEAGRKKRVTWPDAFYVTQDFLVTGEVAAIREAGVSSGAGVLATYSYDASGRRTSLTRGNGTVTRFGYDSASRLAGLAHSFSNAAQNVSSTFSYNPASQIITWGRDNPLYAWTAHHNQNKSYSVNGLNQLSAGGGVSFSYDGRGNLTNQGAGTYGYTAENRLVSAPNNTVLSYDPFGRLAQTSSNVGVTGFQYDDGELLAEYSSSNQLLRRYVHGPGVDEPIVWYEGAGSNNRRWLHVDERGSIVAVTDGNGTSVAINSYDEFGIPGSANLGRFQYTGQTWLPDVGMYYYKARIYSPTLGRFLQRDPVGYLDDLNLYAYTHNDPVNNADSTGNCPSCIGAVSSVVFGAAIRAATGEDIFDAKAIAIDAVSGAVGAGLLNKAGKLVQLARLSSVPIKKAAALGKIGEKAAGLSGDKTAIKIAGRVRIPDKITSTTVTEVKNVATISSRDAAQIADSVTLAQGSGQEAILLTRPTTDVSKVQGLIDSGKLTQSTIPGISAEGVRESSAAASAAAGALTGTARNCFSTADSPCS